MATRSLVLPRSQGSSYLCSPLDLRVPRSQQGIVQSGELPVQGKVVLAQLLPGCQELHLQSRTRGLQRHAETCCPLMPPCPARTMASSARGLFSCPLTAPLMIMHFRKKGRKKTKPLTLTCSGHRSKLDCRPLSDPFSFYLAPQEDNVLPLSRLPTPPVDLRGTCELAS